MKRHSAPLVHRTALALLVAAFLLGIASPREGWAAPGDILVEVRTLSGETAKGRLETLGPTDVSVRTTGGTRSFPLASLLRIENLEPETIPPTGGNALRATLVGGERIVGRFAGSAPDGLVIETADAGKVTIPFDALLSLASLPPGAAVCYEPEARFAPVGKDDVAYVDTGDATTGLLLRAEDTGLVLEAARGQERSVAWDDLAVLHLQNDPPKTNGGTIVEVETVAGSLLRTAALPGVSGGQLVLPLRSAPEVEVRVALSRARRIRAYGTTFVFASDLPFTSTFETPYAATAEDPTRMFLDTWYGARTDRRPNGCPLTLHGVTYEHGFAVHARSRVVIDTGARFQSFLALVGVDDVALRREGGGIVDARVWGDGKVLWEAKDLRAGEAPRVVEPIDVSGVKELTLEVDFGRDGLHVRDYVTWADPVLIGK